MRQVIQYEDHKIHSLSKRGAFVNLRENKENINKNSTDNGQQKISKQQFQILKISAIQLILEKQDIISQLRDKSQISFLNQFDKLREEIQILTQKIRELETKNQQLNEQIREMSQNLLKIQQDWRQQRTKLIQQVHTLFSSVEVLENTINELERENLDLKIENEHFYRQNIDLQVDYRILKQKLAENRNEQLNEPINSVQNLKKLKQSSASFQESECRIPIFSEDPIDYNNTFKAQNHFLSKDTIQQNQDWIRDSAVISIKQAQCLQGSLKQLNLIDNYSVNSKKRGFDCESQFTLKYFKYPQENNLRSLDDTAQASYDHIPEEHQEDQVQIQKDEKDNRMIKQICEKAGILIGGICLGVLFMWKFKR